MPYRLMVWFASAWCYPMAMCANRPGGPSGNDDFHATVRKCGGILPMEWARKASWTPFGFFGGGVLATFSPVRR
jgi:hypothetical protein